MDVPPGFDRVREGWTTLVVRHDVATQLLGTLRVLAHGEPVVGAAPLAGGRGGTVLVRVAGEEVVVRAYRRGGLPGRWVRDRYVGWRARPWRELRVTETLRVAGAPVPEVLGAAVRWVVPGCYRGWLATRYLPGAQTLWEWVVAHPEMRDRVVRVAGRALRRLHDLGGWHPDLNLNNILVVWRVPVEGEPAVTFIDFDRARLGVPGERARAAALARLARSARKLDPAGRYVGDGELDAFRAAYMGGAGCA